MATSQERAAKAVEARLLIYEQEVTAALQTALVGIRSEMAAIFDRFADSDGILTRAEMTRANRLATAERSILAELRPALTANIETMRRLHPEQYQASFFRYAWAIDQTVGVRLDYGRLNIRAITASLRTADYTDALRRYPAVAQRRIREAISNGLIRGQGFKAMMGDLRFAVGQTRGDAFRVIGTEGMRAANAGTIEAFDRAEDEGVEGDVIWVATIDGVTRDQHITTDGQARGDDGVFDLPNGDTGAAPLAPTLSAENTVNCRCTTRFEITGYEPVLRRTRDAGLIPQQSFSEWQSSR